MRRYILTGAPGAGKTSIIRGLAALGRSVVEEAATDVIAQAQARGVDEPWTQPSFIDDIVALQKRRQLEASGMLQFYDRSPVCTYALSLYLGLPVPASLGAEIERLDREGVYERRVLFVENLGFCEPTAARRISFEESLAFEALHVETYRDLGYELVVIERAGLTDRIRAVLRHAEAGGD